MEAEPTPGGGSVRRRKGKRRRGRVALAVLALALVIGAIAFAVWAVRGGSSTSQSQYATATVTRQTLVVTVSASGNMAFNEQTTVQPTISGTVKTLNAKLGQSVKAGDVLYTITNDDVVTAQTQAHANLHSAQQALVRAEISRDQAVQTQDQLEAKTGTAAPTAADLDIADDQVHAARIGYSAAAEGLEVAERNYAQAKKNVDARTVTAPMDGVVTQLTLTEGGSVSSGGSNAGTSGGTTAASSSGSSGSTSASSSSSNGSLVVSQLNSLIADVQVNEVDLPSVKVGQKASLTFDAISGLQLTGKVTFVALQGATSQGVVTYDMNIEPTTLDKRLRPNMTVTAAITTNVRPDVLVVPNAAVKSDTQGSYVQVLSANGTAQRVDVTTGASNDTMTEIKQGLTEGQTVITANLSSSSSSSSSRGILGGGGGGARVFTGGGGPPPGN